MSISITLPVKITDIVTMKYTIGTKSEEKQMQPSTKKTWTFTVTGQGTQNLTVYYNGKTYQTFTVNFDKKTYEMDADYSSTVVPITPPPPSSSSGNG